ncbi:MAG: hypothetical protein QOG16_92 [Actinomycetota bacterium]|nr:hypothetical protein [Actinomycetota bacterium]
MPKGSAIPSFGPNGGGIGAHLRRDPVRTDVGVPSTIQRPSRPAMLLTIVLMVPVDALLGME